MLLLLFPLAAAETVRVFGQPKSGTTWCEVITETIVAETLNRNMSRSRETRQVNYNDVRVEFQPEGSKHGLPGGHKVGSRPFDDKIISVERYYDKLLRPCIESRFPIWSSDCVPEAAMGALGPHRYVLIVRDPRSVAVSSYHYFDDLRERWKLGDYCLDATPKIAALTSLRYYWHDELVRKTNPSLVLFYEDVLNDPVNQIYRIATFLRLHPDMSTMLRVVDATSASAMRRDEARLTLPGRNRPGKESAKVRTASADAFRTELADPQLVDNITRAMAPFLHPALRAKYIASCSVDPAPWCDATY
ncbi:hypothetical protein CTAYLR_002334 [Chrysophaeum taylorii]|uniref:Sulfotransferase domain-containing protein n=1 Tax=Chrysophaeum taylorii TaxID=2483200 RepID=A0AAD7UHT7_9STRA|nr:hypothetical protein CTAYLR_002334 [Chrysophaeum taylorii]